MYLGNGGSGRVGADPFYAFACIYGWDYANGMGWTSLPSPVGIRISLDNGASWIDTIRPEIEAYNATHKYEFKVVGKGERIGFRTIDTDAYDNYGMFKIVVAPEQVSPSAPQNFTAVAGDASVSLSWEAPSTDGGSPITNFTVYRGPDLGNLTSLAMLGNVTSYLDQNVTNGVMYYYAVSASNLVGEGPMTSAISCIPTWSEHYPSCNITSPTGQYVTTSDVTMNWTMSDLVSGIDYAEVRLDTGDWLFMNDSTSHVFVGVLDGPHTLNLRVFNNAGYSNSTSRLVTVDTVSPTNVENSWSQPDASGTLRITFSEAMRAVYGQVDGVPVTFSLQDRNATATVTLEPGTHSLSMTGLDLAGNLAEDFAPFQFNVVEFMVQVSGRVLDGNGDPIAGAQVDIDGVQATSGTDGWFFCSVPPGQHDVEITATGMDDYSGQVTVTDEGGELGNFALTPVEEPDDGGTDWLLIGIVVVVGIALLLFLVLFFKRKKK